MSSVIDGMDNTTEGPASFPSFGCVMLAYEGTMKGSQIRRLLVGVYADCADFSWQLPDATCPEFLRDLAIEMCRIRPRPGSKLPASWRKGDWWRKSKN